MPKMSLPEITPLPTADLAYENPEFIESPDARILRILAEYQEPLNRFRREHIQDTVVFFGSARILPLDVATQRLVAIDTAPKHGSPEDEETANKRKAAETDIEMARYYEDARKLAYLLADWSKGLPGRLRRFVVTSGGGPGIMEAANRGASEAGGKTIGLNIALPFEQHPNPYITPSLNFQFHYFFMRKFWLAYMAKALVVFPGGFGTFDEMFELLTLAQTRKFSKPMTIIVYGSDYWNSVINVNALVEKGVISHEDKDLFRFADTPEDAFAILKESLLKHCPTCSPHDRVPEDSPKSVQDMLGPDIASTRA